MDIIDLEGFRRTPLVREPYDHLVVPRFIKQAAMPGLLSDWPAIDQPGSVPVGVYPHGATFDRLLAELARREVAQAFGDKFGLDLAPFPQMVTVRAQCRESDGKVHVDSASKIITVLLYMNPPWEASGGRLRILRSPDLDDVVAELPPEMGTLLAFRRSERSWHGHLPHVGPRRALQLNWVRGRAYIRHEQLRHRLGAWAKAAVRRLQRIEPPQAG